MVIYNDFTHTDKKTGAQNGFQMHPVAKSLKAAGFWPGYENEQ